jgi:hypothetical protein
MGVAAWTEGSTFSLFVQVQHWYRLSYLVAAILYVVVSLGFVIAGLIVHKLTDLIGRWKVNRIRAAVYFTLIRA